MRDDEKFNTYRGNSWPNKCDTLDISTKYEHKLRKNLQIAKQNMQSTFEELLILNGKMVETDHLTHLFPFNPFFIPFSGGGGGGGVEKKCIGNRWVNI